MLHSPLNLSTWKHGDRVELRQTGTVTFERNGIVRVSWDDGYDSEVWGASLTNEQERS